MSLIVINKANIYEPAKDCIEVTDIPDAFFCPLTMNVMVDPIASKYGHNFERSAILEWLEADINCESLCPMTRRPLFPSMLIANTQLKFRIRNWRIARGEKFDFDLEEERGNEDMDDSYNYCLDSEPETEGVTEFDTEIDAEVEAQATKIVEMMLQIADSNQQTQAQGKESQQQEASSKKIRNSRGFLGRFGRKSKR